MTFTYNLAGGFTDLTRVRFHVGDTDSPTALFQDEEISAIVAEQGTWQKAVIACLENVIARLSYIPNFRSNSLQVDYTSALQHYTDLLAKKQQELGVAGVTATIARAYRADSQQTAEPDYSAGV